MQDPKTIFQNLLDEISSEGMKGGSDALVSFFSLPYLHEAIDTKIMLENEDDLRTGLKVFYDTLTTKGVTQTIRLVSNADYLSPNYIEGVYVTHVLRGAVPVVRSYTNRAVVRRSQSGWKLTHTQNGFSHKVWPIRVFYVPDDPPDYKTGREDDVRRDAMEPLAIYQSFINRMTEANVAADEQAYLSLCMFPHWVHLNQHDEEITSEEQVCAFVRSVSDLLATHEVEDFVRIADHAEFVSSSEICGYHTTHFLRGGDSALEPVKSRIILKRIGTRWFLSSVTNSLNNEDYTYSHPIPTDELVTQLAIQQRTKSWPTLQ